MAQRDRQKRIVPRLERPLVLVETESPYIRDQVIAYVRDWGWDLRAWFLTNYEWPPDKPVAGALVDWLPTNKGSRRLLEKGIPTVRLGNLPHPEDAVLPAVLPDMEAQGRIAVEHFHERGFQYVAFVGYNPEDAQAARHGMFAAFRKRAEELGMTCDLMKLDAVAVGKPDSRWSARLLAIEQWLTRLPQPVGIFSFSDAIIVQILAACSRRGLAVPEEIALLGCGNTNQCELAQIGLSSVDPADPQRVRAALELLRNLMAGKSRPRKPIMVPPEGIVTRRSSDVLAVPDLRIAKALRFVWEHYAENLSIEDIANAVNMPRRSLERGFRKYLNRSVHAELARKRVTELHDLLLSSNEPVVELAPLAGFFTLSSANRSFHKTYGISPGQFRSRHGLRRRGNTHPTS